MEAGFQYDTTPYVIWNFGNFAGTIHVKSGYRGRLIAPLATISLEGGGWYTGQIIAAKIINNGIINQVTNTVTEAWVVGNVNENFPNIQLPEMEPEGDLPTPEEINQQGQEQQPQPQETETNEPTTQNTQEPATIETPKQETSKTNEISKPSIKTSTNITEASKKQKISTIPKDESKKEIEEKNKEISDIETKQKTKENKTLGIAFMIILTILAGGILYFGIIEYKKCGKNRK